MMTEPDAKIAQPLWVRVSHWLNALAVFIMVFSGWQIYNASPLFRFVFPRQVTLGGWLGGGLQWHFAGMWLFVATGIFYLAMGVATGRFRRKFWPLDLRELIGNIRDVLTFRLRHDDLSHYNMIQKLLYLGVIAALIVMVLTGLAIWKPVQFSTLCGLFGDYDVARHIHFYSMSFIAFFIVVHVTLAMLVPRTLKGMTVGRF